METNNNPQPETTSVKGWKHRSINWLKSAGKELFEVFCFFASGLFYIIIQGEERGQKMLDILFNQGFNLQTVIFWIGFVIVASVTSKVLELVLELIGRFAAFVAKIIWYTLVFLFKVIFIWPGRK